MSPDEDTNEERITALERSMRRLGEQVYVLRESLLTETCNGLTATGERCGARVAEYVCMYGHTTRGA